MPRLWLIFLAALALASHASAQPAAGAPEVAVFHAHAAGVDPRAALWVTLSLRSTAEKLGWVPVSDERTRAALAQAGSGGLSPERALAATRTTAARYGVFANVSADGGRYLVAITLIPADGGAPRTTRAQAAHGELESASERALRELLPPAASAPASAPVAPVPSPAMAPAPIVPQAPPPVFEQRFRLALQTEAAFGVATGPFYNHLAGARLDRRFSEEFSLGAYAAYANLKGKQGRAHNVLMHFLLEYRAALSQDWGLPLRFAPGYLPKNGPTLRLSAGLSFEPSEDLELVLEPLVPMVWMTGDKAVLSLNVAAELAFGL